MIEQIQFAKLFGVTHIDSLLQEMLLGGKFYIKSCLFSVWVGFGWTRWINFSTINTDSILGGIDNSPALIVPGQVTSPQPPHLNGNSYQNSDSTDSPVTSPTTMPGSPADQLINGGGVASPQGHTGRSEFFLLWLTILYYKFPCKYMQLVLKR